jgi:hypothetical protein
MAKSRAAKETRGAHLRPCGIGIKDKLQGMQMVRCYAILRQIDEERLRQRISSMEMPGTYQNHMLSGDPRLTTLIRMLDKLGLELKIIRKGGGEL